MTATYALIPAAGRGTRYGASDGNKVFAPLLDRPVLRWTVEAFAAHPAIDGIVVIVGAQETALCREALAGIAKVLAIVPGGASRQESVRIGLFALGGQADDLIVVHDGARPLVTSAVIDRCLAGARLHGNAVAAIPVADTLKIADAANIVTQTVDRNGLWAIQTPQVFSRGTLLAAHVAADAEGFTGTDEASLVERSGAEPVHLVPGSSDNGKITRAEDIVLAQAILKNQQGLFGYARVGFGYDIHRFAPGRRLVLGGVEIPDASGRGLDGHSDADVLLHALCDALLGAAALPDIGTLYPNTDPAYDGADSRLLLADVARRLTDAGFQIINVDATVIAEAPKLAPYVPQMRAAIAAVLHLESTQVGIKATTNERLGALGQEQGIAAHAVAAIMISEPFSGRP